MRANQDIPDEFIIFSVPGQLSFSKRRSHREQTLLIFTALCNFLEQNDLVNEKLLDEQGQVSDKLEVRRKDFTAEGFEFYRRAEQKWLTAIDRGKPPSDTSILERELRKLRSEKTV
jgi:hypothetical protein